jgi:hypothetical protein
MSVSSALGSKFPMPIGAILPYLGQSPPSSFLVCDGTTYDISNYPLLFNALSTYYGGDGITTFSVPDLTLAFISGTAQNTSPPTTTTSGGSFSGLFDLGSISTANLPANIPINPPLNDPSLANNFVGQIGYTNGVVKYTGDINGDLTVILQHGKYFTMSTHLSSINVSVGQEVKAGTVLGRSGINLEGEGSLLFVLSKEGKSIDPENWLKNRR